MAQTCKRVVELAKRLPLVARTLASKPGSEFAGHTLVEQIVSLIEQRAALTIRRLIEPAANAGLSGD